MSPRWPALALALAPLILGARAVRAQEPAPGAAARSSGDRLPERLQARWRGLPREERETLERRLEELERLPPDARRELLERAHRLRERERELLRGSPADLRRRMDALGPRGGRELWKQHVREHFRERGRALRQRMPEDLRRRVEALRPEDRGRMLEHLHRGRDGASRRAIRRLGALLHLRPAEIRALERLPLEERLQVLMELRQRLLESPRPAGPR